MATREENLQELISLTGQLVQEAQHDDPYTVSVTSVGPSTWSMDLGAVTIAREDWTITVDVEVDAVTTTVVKVHPFEGAWAGQDAVSAELIEAALVAVQAHMAS